MGSLLFLRVSFFASCAFDGRSLTELLFQNKPGTIFTCKIIKMTVPKATTDGDFMVVQSCGGGIDGTAIAKIVMVYFGKVDTSIITLRTGTQFVEGKSYLIYTEGEGRIFSCGGSCDTRTHELVDSPEQKNELLILQQFHDIFKSKKSGKFNFVSGSKILLASGEYKRGIAVNLWKHYYNNGILKTEQDLFNKRTKYFNGEGFILADNTEYKDSTINLVYSGSVKGLLNYRYVNFKNEKGFTVTMYEYYSNGKLKLLESTVYLQKGSGTSTDGKIGKYIEGYENGNYKVIGAMLKTKRIGLWKWYNEDGTFSAEVDYKDGSTPQ